MNRLSHHDHRRDLEGLTYVYPVLSRRSGGLSIGINLSPNNACNFACLYCQVPDLIRGSSPVADTGRLTLELLKLLEDHRSGAFHARHEISPEEGVIRDLAISGNGEPTSCPNLIEVIRTLDEILIRQQIHDSVPKVLITNGSLLHKRPVRTALGEWGDIGGEIWFKLDRGTSEGMDTLNQIHYPMERVLRNLERCLACAPTWIQTCLVSIDGREPEHFEWNAYLELIGNAQKLNPLRLRGVHFYGLARPSMQPGKDRLSPVSKSLPEKLMAEIRKLGLEATFHA